jgi:hypothetical protein
VQRDPAVITAYLGGATEEVLEEFDPGVVAP